MALADLIDKIQQAGVSPIGLSPNVHAQAGMGNRLDLAEVVVAQNANSLADADVPLRQDAAASSQVGDTTK